MVRCGGTGLGSSLPCVDDGWIGVSGVLVLRCRLLPAVELAVHLPNAGLDIVVVEDLRVPSLS